MMNNRKLSRFLSTPLGVVMLVSAVALAVEIAFMELLHEFLVVRFEISDTVWSTIDAVVLTALLVPALYFLVFKKIQADEARIRQIGAAAQDAIIVVNEHARITDWNPAAQKMFQYSAEEALGQPLHQLLAPSRLRADADRGFARFEESGEGPLIGNVSEVVALRKDGSEFSVELSISAFKVRGHRHAIGIVRDISARKRQAERTAALLELSTSAENLDEKTLLQKGLNTLQHLTDSRIGFLHFVSEDQNEIELVTWSSDTLAHYCQAAFDQHYPVSTAGIWADCVRLKQAVIINDYATATDKKGLPEGHSHLQRFISVPIFDGKLVRMIVGVGNAAMDYDEHDVETIKLFSYDLYRIVQHNRAEQVLQKNENKYRRLIENSPDIVYTFSVKRGTIYCTSQVITTLGYTAEHLYTNPFLWNESIHPEDRAVVAKAIEEFKTGTIFKIEYRIKNAHGDWCWFYDRSIGGRQENGDFIIEGLAMDITERKHMEAAFATLVGTAAANIGAAFFRETVRSLSAWLGAECVILGELQDGNRVRALAMQLDGKAVEQYEYALPGTPCNSVASKGYCEYPEGVCQLFPEDKDLVDMGAEAYIGTPIRDNDGKTIGVLCAISRHKLVVSPMLKGVFKVLAARAGTEIERQRAEVSLRNSETRLQTIVENLTEGLAVSDLDGQLLHFNRAALDLHGFSTLDECRQHLSKFADTFELSALDGTVLPLDQWPLARVLRGENLRNLEVHVRHLQAGWQRTYNYGGTLARAADGQPLLAILIISDITERTQSENKILEMLDAAKRSRESMLSVVEDQMESEAALRQLNLSLEEKVLERTAALDHARLDAEQANRAKSQFLATMSHEIRTPLNGVIGMVDVLQQSSLKIAQVEMVDIIRDSARALLTVINDILDFSRIEAGKLEIESLPLSAAAVVEKACETMKGMALRNGVELTLFTDPAIPAQLIGDPGRLRQILTNLTNNAIKFSAKQQRQGKVAVRVLLAESAPEQIRLEFRVTDNGIGIDAATQARLFAPFTQADASTTRTYGGTGLGLAISRQLANIMDGQITLQSEPDKGSVFSVHLPFKLPPQQPAAAPSLVAGLPCLLVDDAHDLASDFAAYLEYDGATVERTADLATARKWIAHHLSGLCIVIIDGAENKLMLDKLRAAARSHPEQKTHFLTILRGQREQPRLEKSGLVSVDCNVLTHKMLLKAAAIAAGRAQQVEQEELPTSDSAAPTQLSRRAALRRGRLILVAEDNEINQKVILQQMALLGQTADIANNGLEALEMWQSGDYALLFADLHMPKMDGYQLTTAIRAAEKAASNETSQPHTPIVAFTANALKGEADNCIAIGMDDYLSKPVQLVDLKAMLEKWLPAVGAGPARETKIHRTQGVLLQQQEGDDAAPVDVDVLKKLVGDDEAMIRDFLNDFRVSAAKVAVELRAACAAGQAAAAGALAHKLKSSARSVGALALGELCATMEASGKDGAMAAITELLPRFEQELARVENFLEHY